jgi:hypothetical protein
MSSGISSNRRARYAFFGDLVILEGPNDAAAGKDQHTIAQPLQFDRVGRKHYHAGSRRSGVPDDPIELDARAGIDAPRRLVGEEHRRLFRQGAGEQNLLLVAA